MKFIKTSAIAFACLFCASCMNATNDKLDTMNGNMNRMATQVESDQAQIQSLNGNSGRIAKETEVYENSIKALADELKVIADTMVEFKKMGLDFQAMLKDAFKPAAPAATSDIQDVISEMNNNKNNGAGGAPSK